MAPLRIAGAVHAKRGDEIVGRLYRFKDKGDRDGRAEGRNEADLASDGSGRVQELKKPIRWFSIPQLFRYDASSGGRLERALPDQQDIIGEACSSQTPKYGGGRWTLRALGLGDGGYVTLRVSDPKADQRVDNQ